MILSLERSPSPVDKYPWTLWQRIIMVCTAFFVSILMSGVTVGHLGMRMANLHLLPFSSIEGDSFTDKAVFVQEHGGDARWKSVLSTGIAT